LAARRARHAASTTGLRSRPAGLQLPEGHYRGPGETPWQAENTLWWLSFAPILPAGVRTGAEDSPACAGLSSYQIVW